MEKKEKPRVIHDLTFSCGGADVRKSGGRREQGATLETGGRPVNTNGIGEGLTVSAHVSLDLYYHVDSGITGNTESDSEK